MKLFERLAQITVEAETKHLFEVISRDKQPSLDEIPEENKNGNCFVSSYQYFQSHIHSDKDLKLAHGIIKGQGAIAGIWYVHAWCQDNHYVYDMTLPKQYQIMPIQKYYALSHAKDVVLYDQKQVAQNSLKFKTYGPWDKKLLDNPY